MEQAMDDDLAVRLKDVGVKFRLMHERISTLKETVINLLLRRSYFQEDLWAIRHLNLKVRRGMSAGIIGRNGSGKSTLLRVVAGVMRPTEGDVEVDGEISSLLELGAGFDPELSGTDNVYLSGALLGARRREMEEKFPEILEFSALGSFIDVPVKNYSSGMYVRLAFSIAIHVDPDILLVDEVLAVGDEAFQGKCIDRIRTFRDLGKTLLIASHDLGLLQELCDVLVLLDMGEVKAIGPPREVSDRYRELLQSSDGAGVGAQAPGG
jgi:ABC-type polysaccharide/polyol phosphate transport system ATPase subunit